MLVTNKGFQRICPECGESVTIVGKYGYRPDGSLGLLQCECPIEHNAKLPPQEYNVFLPPVRCQGPLSCGIEPLPPTLRPDELD